MSSPLKTSSTSGTQNYIGRFAPTPSGPLHMGSLVCALASYLDAKAQNGQWLLRIEDIDKPREVAGASDKIIHALQTHGLHWDSELTYQSHNTPRYLETVEALQAKRLSYRCDCIRKRLTKLNPGYDGFCRDRDIAEETPHALRINLQAASEVLQINAQVEINDRIQKSFTEDLIHSGDFMIRRKDGLFSYHLAVVVDDIAQGITDIVRGYDLYECTPHQKFLTQALGAQPVKYAHIPVVSFENGRKLSKQNHAPAIDDSLANENLFQALQLLMLSPPEKLKCDSIENILNWGKEHWDIEALKNKTEIIL